MTRSPATRRHRRLVVLAALLALAVSLAGCNVFQGPAEQSPPVPNASTAAERYANVDGFRGTLNVTKHHEGNVSWAVQRIATRPGTGEFRNEVLAVGPPSADQGGLGVGSLIVSNGSVRYIYAAESETGFRSRIDADARRNRTGDIRRLVAELRDDDNGTIRRPTPGVSPLPVVPAEEVSRSENGSVEWRDDEVYVRYRGTATVAGRSTYVVDLRPASSAAALVEATLWLDTETLFPLKRHAVTYSGGERYEYTSVYRDVTFDASFPAGTFELDPAALPGNVSTTETRSFDSRAAMVDAFDRPVLDPEVPDRFAFDSGFYSGGEVEHLSLSYTTPDERETIRVSVFADSANLTEGRQVTVAGERAAFTTFRGNRYLTLNVDGRQVTVTGTVGNETLRRVAASLVDE
jgi:outer membrane lipoprotein-sorting protein